jgi:hypothetical protein
MCRDRRILLGLFLIVTLGLPASRLHGDEPKRAIAAAARNGIDARPDPAAVQRFGPAYRYPQDGWTVLHIEGEPYDRGYQHGRLMAPEIAGHLKCFAMTLSPKAPSDDWQSTRRLANALFLRRFEREYLEEMKGIADGANESGARFYGRPIDVVDIVALNCWPEIETLDSALEATPTGLEGLKFPHAQPRATPKPRPEHCSAFAATGPATADGKIVFGHITMFSLYAANFYNVWLDIKPAKGHRVLMCAYPGAMQSGLDYYMNDAGLLIAETTIAQTRFDINGHSEASRIRQAIQYASTIDEAVSILKTSNNGLYTNEWLLGDINTNEIALFELGTQKNKLHRSSKNEWIGGTSGFYWGCNNTKDIELRLESIPSTQARPANLVFRPSDRDQMWQKLYHQHKGKIGEAFGFEAFTTPPLVSISALDAKFTTTDLAKDLKSWALFGPPLGRTWHPTFEQKQRFPDIKPLVSNPWTILHGKAPPASTVVAVDVPSFDSAPAKQAAAPKAAGKRGKNLDNVPLWRGTILPQTDGDIWLATAFADYEKIAAADKGRGASQADRDALALDLFPFRSAYLTAARTSGDVALANIKTDVARDDWYRIASGKGVLALHELRKTLGDPLFEETMDSFGMKHAGQRVSTAQFQAHVERAAGKSLAAFFDAWVKQPSTPSLLKSSGASLNSFFREQDRSLIIYGTADEEPSNREAAENLQKLLRETGPNFTIAIKSDKDVSEDELRTHHLLLIGRPDSNALVARFQKSLPIAFGARSFVVRDKTYANPGSAVAVAADNPLNDHRSVVVIAGLGAESTFHAPAAFLRSRRAAQVVVLPHEGSAQPLVLRN